MTDADAMQKTVAELRKQTDEKIQKVKQAITDLLEEKKRQTEAPPPTQ